LPERVGGKDVMKDASREWLALVPTARRIGVSEATTRKLGDTGILPARRLANGRRVFWRPGIERYLAEQAQYLRERAVKLETGE
jgi:type II secretory pathway component PulM